MIRNSLRIPFLHILFMFRAWATTYASRLRAMTVIIGFREKLSNNTDILYS